MNKKQKKSVPRGKSAPAARAVATQSPLPALAAILIISFLVYLPVLDNSLLAWDDHHYIRDNSLVTSFNLKEIFSTPVMGNYHPVTILVLSAGYHLFGLDADGFHGLNLLFHLLNVCLVFLVLKKLSANNTVALVAALLFGVHPIHVESVAWAAELKDLLYTFFFLASYLAYLVHIKKPGMKFYFLSLLLFTVALLSKAMAASLPVVFLLTDFFLGRKMGRAVILEKIPFFLLATGLGIVAVIAQKTQSNPDEFVFAWPERILFACSAFVEYLCKLALPIQLYAFYPYPVLSGQPLPSYYWLYPACVVLLAAACIYSLKHSKKIFFGMGFFALTVFLVLQLLQVGAARMADRYCYVPSIGIFLLAGFGVDWLRRRGQSAWAWAALAVFSVFCSYKTFTQCAVWKNDLSLWNDVIRQDTGVAVAYNNRAMVYMKENDDRALADFSSSIRLNPNYFLAIFNRGVHYNNKKKYTEAIADYSVAIRLKPDYTEAFINRGNALMELGRLAEARADYDKAVVLSPGFAKIYLNRGLLSMKENRHRDAIADFLHALQLNPGYEKAWLNCGNAQMNERRYEDARTSYTRLLALNAGYPEAYYNRAWAEYLLNDKAAACQDLEMARTRGHAIPDDALSRACRE